MKDKKLSGLAPQSLKSCLATLDLYLQQDRPVVSSFIPFQHREVGTIDTTDTLVNIAANILGVKDIKKVNFKAPLSDLGLDSLMAAELAQVLQSRANIQLPQKAYTQLTFEKIAKIDASGGISTEGSNENSKHLNKVLIWRPISDQAVIKMKSLETSKAIVFIVHPMDGTILMLEELVSQLDATVYGIECVREAPLESIEKLAAYYLQKVREIQPAGPYKIAGYSFGGTVAFEMALQFENKNEVVSLLMLLDASPRLKQITENWTEASKKEWENAIFLGYLTQFKSDVSSSQMKELLEIKSTYARMEYVAQLLHETYPGISLAEIKESVAGCLVRVQCAFAYETSGKVKARTVLVKALQRKADKNEPNDLGLSSVCENGVEVVEVDGNHYCFYEKPIELGLPWIVNKIIA
jgi:fatty acid synthase